MDSRYKLTKQNKRQLWIVACFLCTTFVFGLGYHIHSSEVTIISRDPSARVLVNGNLILRGEGRRSFFPFRRTYLIDIQNKRGRDLRRIFPFSSTEDYSTVEVEKAENFFFVPNTKVVD